MFAITGASGQLGRLVITQLLKTVPASQIVAIVRTPSSVADLAAQGVQVRQADYNQADAVQAALQGVQRLLLISSSEIGQREAQHRNLRVWLDRHDRIRMAHGTPQSATIGTS